VSGSGSERGALVSATTIGPPPDRALNELHEGRTNRTECRRRHHPRASTPSRTRLVVAVHLARQHSLAARRPIGRRLGRYHHLRTWPALFESARSRGGCCWPPCSRRERRASGQLTSLAVRGQDWSQRRGAGALAEMGSPPMGRLARRRFWVDGRALSFQSENFLHHTRTPS
jgi:hypothetical protein